VKIIGGQVAVPHSWPAQVYLLFRYSAYVFVNATLAVPVSAAYQWYYITIITLNVIMIFLTFNKLFMYIYYSGGTLINPDTILTAAHCVISSLNYEDPEGNPRKVIVPPDASFYSVYLGYQNISGDSDGKGVIMSAKYVRVVRYTLF
jgi:hypothetical protein